MINRFLSQQAIIIPIAYFMVILRWLYAEGLHDDLINKKKTYWKQLS